MYSYSIEDPDLLEFLAEDIDFPRYQRKKTWKEDKNFELAISIFQKYPVGILIIDKKVITQPGGNLTKKMYMLDGRQRHTALKAIVENPTEVYRWALKYLDFAEDADDNTIEASFEKAMKALLTREDEPDSSEEPNGSEEPNNSPSSAGTSADDNKKDEDTLVVQYTNSLYLLLDLILMVHNVPLTIKGVKGKKAEKTWESLFDFSYNFYDKETKSFNYGPPKQPRRVVVEENLCYCDENDGEILLPDLRRFIVDYSKYCGAKNTKEKFIEYCKQFTKKFKIKDSETFEEMVQDRWKWIEKSVVVFSKTESLFSSIKIGEILLTDASPLDSLTIFSRVNTNGVNLNPEELLSAKPYWNKNANKTLLNEDIKGKIRTLYTDTLGFAHNGSYTRWDIGATLIDRLDDQFLFEKKKKSANFTGFRLLASFYSGGMSKVELAYLEDTYNEGRIWTGEDFRRKPLWLKQDLNLPTLDGLIDQLKDLFDILLEHPFFDRLYRSHTPISKLLGIAPLFEFITVLWTSWTHPDDNKRERKSNATIQEEAIRLFDKLVYEVMRGEWGSAGDSKMRTNILSWRERVKNSQPLADWESLIDSLSDETNKLDYTEMAPILYYFEALKGNGFPQFPAPENTGKKKTRKKDINKEPYSIDHILPQASFGDDSAYNKNSLANLLLLHRSHNSSKGDTPLDKLTEELKKVVAEAAGIDVEKLKDYSGANSDPDSKFTFASFVDERKKCLKDLLRKNRPKLTGGK